ncbi:hypothetical protein [Rhizobium leguminosarum]|nr:hypothetical protein HB775_28600 [Rhizobium leguminosarum bv. trifolii]
MFVLKTRDGVLDSGDRGQLERLREALSIPGKKVHLHLHGGLIDQAAGIEIAKKLADKTTGIALDGWERVFVVWRTGAIETLKINWTEIFENDRLYRILLRRLLKFMADRIGQNDTTGRTLGVGLGLTNDEIRSRLDSKGQGNPFADIDEISFAGTPSGRSISTASDEGVIGTDFKAALKADSTFQEIVTDITSALTRSPVTGRSALATGNATDGARVLKNLNRRVVKELKKEVPAEEGARALFSSAAILFYLLDHGKNIAVKVFMRFKLGRHHGLYATIIEEIVRELYGDLIGSSVWGMMKQDAADHFAPGRLGGELMNLLEESRPETVLVTAHSAGSIWATEMLDYLEEMSLTVRVKLVFLAPAVRADRFGPVISKTSGFIDDFRMFTMPDHLERKDPVLGADFGYLYPSSLLYLVSGLFEDRDADAFVDAPILGMARFLAADFPNFSDQRDVSAASAVKSFLDRPNHLVLAMENSNPGFKCKALSHGGFDDDPDTLASIADFVR